MEEPKAKQAATSSEAIIITVEELERRKDRFRKATKEYYEQAEKGYRILHGFCGPTDGVSSGYGSSSAGAFHWIHDEREHPHQPPSRRKRKPSEAPPNERQTPCFRAKSLKRCRRRRFPMPRVAELETDLAERLLESHFGVVDLALREYLSAIRHLVRPAPNLVSSWWQEENEDRPPRTSLVLRLPSVELPLPLPIAFDTSGECLPDRLKRHRSEAVEEEHLAMASVMKTCRESKRTQDLAQKIYDGVRSIREGLRKISVLIEANRNNTYFCCHYDCFRSDSEETIFKPSAILQHTGPGTTTKTSVAWDRKVVDALKLDGYYRWFRDNNGVLLDQNNDDEERDDRDTNGSGGGGSSSVEEDNHHGACSCQEVQEFLVLGEGGEQVNVRISHKRLRKVSVDEQQQQQQKQHRVCHNAPPPQNRKA